MRDKSTNETLTKGRASRCKTRTAVFVIFISIAIAFVAVKGHTASGKKKAAVQKPTPCHSLEKVESETIYLTTQTYPCPDGANPIPVEIDASIKKVRVFVDGAFWREQQIVDLNSIQDSLEKSRAMEKTIRIPEGAANQKGSTSAEAAARQFASDAFQGKIQKETERIKRDLFHVAGRDKNIDHEGSGESSDQTEIGLKTGSLSSSERLYVFVSSSMPLATLRNYAADLARLSDGNVTMVMRGFVGGMQYAQPTLKLVSDVIVKDLACKKTEKQCDAHNVNFIVDPLLFRMYQIRQVPAVVYVPSYRSEEPGGSEGLGEAPKYYALYGDASLAYVVERIQKETQSPSLKRILAKLQQ